MPVAKAAGVRERAGVARTEEERESLEAAKVAREAGEAGEAGGAVGVAGAVGAAAGVETPAGGASGRSKCPRRRPPLGLLTPPRARTATHRLLHSLL